MSASIGPRARLVPLLTLLLFACAPLAGCGLMDRAEAILYPSATPTTEAPPVASATSGAPIKVQPTQAPAQPATMAPTFTPGPPTQPSPPPTLAPTPQKGQFLLYAQAGGIYRGDRLGGEAVEIARVPMLESWALHQGQLAIAHGRAVELIDLRAGALTSITVAHTGRVEHAELLWGVAGKTLLYAGAIEDQEAGELGRSVLLRAYARQDGAEVGAALIRNVTGVQLLRHDDARGQAMLVPIQDGATLERVEVYDLRTGALTESGQIQGEGRAIASADGQFILIPSTEIATGQRQVRFYPLTGDSGAAAVWEQPANTQSDGHLWSPDGRHVAMLMRDGSTPEEATAGLGLWVLDLANLEAQEIVKDDALSSTLVAWSPDSELILGHHRGSDGSYYFVVRPDGGGRQILSLGEEAQVLGWIESADASLPPLVEVDPWRAAILDSAGRPEALAQVVAEMVASQAQGDPETMAQQLRVRLADAGWDSSQGPIGLTPLGEGAMVAQLPVRSIYLLEAGRATLLARGDMVIDARLVGNELGLIFGSPSGGALQPAFMLYSRDSDSASDPAWRVAWAPMGQRDWIATDGEIRFIGEGLDRLEVRGTTFGLSENETFVECRDCLHRRLHGVWERREGGYERRTELPADRSLVDSHWEMTERTPYALLHEFLRRARAGLATAELADEAALRHAQELGLLIEKVRLRATEETAAGVRFSELEGERIFLAQIEGDRVVRITAGN